MITLGIDLGGTKIAGGILRNGRLEKYNCQKTKSEAKVLEIKRQIVKIIDKIITKEVEAIGIGVPGLVDDKGVAYEAVNISAFGKVPIRKILEKRYSLPVYIDNDANCFVLGEKHFGLGKNYHNLMGVTLGTGMGTVIIIKDKLYRGKCGGAGEFGQVVYQNGVFEHYSSGQFFLRQY